LYNTIKVILFVSLHSHSQFSPVALYAHFKIPPVIGLFVYSVMNAVN